MNKYLLVLLFLVVNQQLAAQNADPIEFGTKESLYSKVLGEERQLMIYVPEDLGGVYLPQKYPVLYILDGDAHFFSVSGMIRQLSSANGNTVIPKMIVVAILNTNRTRDLTPRKGDPNHPFSDSTLVAQSGGGEAFMKFIETELMPFIDGKFSTNPYKMFVGHSFGGLTVMNTFAKQPELFNAYVSIDPSMWWADRALLNQIKKSGFDDRYKGKSLFLGIANTVGEDADLKVVRKEGKMETDHILAILELDDKLKFERSSDFRYDSEYYPDDSHGSVPLITTYDAFRFIFENYNLDLSYDDFMNPDIDVAGRISTHYQMLSGEFGFEVKPAERYINETAYQFLNRDMMEKAGKMFKMNVENYPDSFNVHDSLGDFYEASGQKDEAIKAFRQALGINSDAQFTSAKLQKLLKTE